MNHIADAPETLPPSDDCLRPSSLQSLLIGIWLMTGAAAAFIPQYISIVKKKSSFGISYLFLIAGLSAAAFTGANAGLLNWPHIACCWTQKLSFGDCIANNLAFLQIFFNLVWFTILAILFIVYCVPVVGHFTSEECEKSRKWAKIALVALAILVSSICVTSAVFFYVFHARSVQIAEFADWVGYVGAVAMALQYLPQIRTTMALQSSGSLSVVTLLITLPGYVLTIYFQGILNSAPLSTWLPNVFASIELLLLIGLIGAFACYRKYFEVDYGPTTTENTLLEIGRAHV